MEKGCWPKTENEVQSTLTCSNIVLYLGGPRPWQDWEPTFQIHPEKWLLYTVSVAFIKPYRWEEKMCVEPTYTASALFSITSLKWFRVLLEHRVSMGNHMKAVCVLVEGVFGNEMRRGYNRQHRWDQQKWNLAARKIQKWPPGALQKSWNIWMAWWGWF